MGSSNNFLSRKDKEQGQKNYLTYTFINGLSYSFLAETIIYLLAMYFGANNMQLGYISSAVYLTGVMVFFVPILFPRVKIIKLFSRAWLLRGIVSLGYGLTLILSDNFAVIAIIIVYTFYCLFRNIAYPFNHMLQGYITKPSERGSYASKVIIFLYSSMMLSRFISFSTLSLFKSKELYGLLFLLALGIILNTGASYSIGKIPVKDSIEKRNIKEAFNTFRFYMKQPGPLLIILLYCGGMSLFVLFNFSIPFLTKEIHISSNIIFIYTTINFAGVLLASSFIRPFLNAFGSKPLLIITNLIIVCLSIVWSLGSENTMPFLLFFLGFVSMFFIGMIRLLLDRLIINSIPKDDRVGFTSALAVVFSIISLIIGLSGGFLAELSSAHLFSVNNEYSLTFILMALVGILNTVVAILIKEKGSMPVNELIHSITDRKKLKTIHNLDKLERSNNDIEKKMILIEIQSDDTQLATKEISKRLKLATLRDKEMVIRSLFSNPRPELELELIEEALDKYSWWRQSAIFSLGAYNTENSRKTLRKIFKEKYPYIKSIAAKSMARVGDFSCQEEVNELLAKPGLDVRTYVNLVIAVSLIESNGTYWESIFRLIKDCDSHRFLQTMFIIGCTRLNFTPSISDIYHDLNTNIRDGFDSIFEELADLDLTEEDFNSLNEFVNQNNYYKIWSWCRNRCKHIKLMEPYEPLRNQILLYKKRKIEPSTALAGLYITIQLEGLYKKTQKSIAATIMPE